MSRFSIGDESFFNLDVPGLSGFIKLPEDGAKLQKLPTQKNKKNCI